jgi:hypothetical protein
LIAIRFRSPAKNNNGDAVNADHIDLIAGGMTGPISPSDANYKVAVGTALTRGPRTDPYWRG